MVRAEVQSHNITTKGMFSMFKHFYNRMGLILFSVHLCSCLCDDPASYNGPS